MFLGSQSDATRITSPAETSRQNIVKKICQTWSFKTAVHKQICGVTAGLQLDENFAGLLSILYQCCK